MFSLTDPVNNTTTWTYDDLNRVLTDTNGVRKRGHSTFLPTAAGNLLSLTDPVNNTTSWTYDDLNRVLTDTNELGKSRSFVYDALGNLTERTDRNGKVRELDYDLLSRLTGVRKRGHSTFLPTAAGVRKRGHSTFLPTAAGNLLSLTDPVNNTTSWTYDGEEKGSGLFDGNES